jgi:hypothetical protein
MILLVQHLRSNYDWRSVIRKKKKNVREIHVVSLDIVGNVVLPLRLTAELDVRVCKAFAGTPVFSLFLPLFHSHIYREREQLQLMHRYLKLMYLTFTFFFLLICSAVCSLAQYIGQL